MREDGELWFVAVDVCKALGIVNSRDALSRLDADQKGVVITVTSSNGLIQKRKVTAINEPGLNDLTLDSRKPEARRIRKWVVKDVMPALRKTGRYQIGHKNHGIRGHDDRLGQKSDRRIHSPGPVLRLLVRGESGQNARDGGRNGDVPWRGCLPDFGVCQTQ